MLNLDHALYSINYGIFSVCTLINMYQVLSLIFLCEQPKSRKRLENETTLNQIHILESAAHALIYSSMHSIMQVRGDGYSCQDNDFHY